MKKIKQRIIVTSLRLIIGLVIVLFATVLLSRVAVAEVTEEWIVNYNSPANSTDIPWALAVDNKGNVYVTGWSHSGTSWDYATVKYDTFGNKLWPGGARYNGSGNGADYAQALAVDAQGNVYVTGTSSGSDSGQDYVTVKYDPNGTPLWGEEGARYNGPGNGDDVAWALAVDVIVL